MTREEFDGLLRQLTQQKDALAKARTADEKYHIEKEKQAIYAEVAEKLNAALNVSPIQIKQPPMYSFKKRLEATFLTFFLLGGLFRDGIGNFLFAETLLLLLAPGMGPLALCMVSVSLALMHCMMFYAFEASFFEHTLGFTFLKPVKNSLIQVYHQQLETTESINQKIFDILTITQLDKEAYDQFVRLALEINQDIRDKQTSLQSYNEGWPTKILRWMIIGFGAAMAGASVFFLMDKFIMLISISSPLGWCLIGLMVASAIGFYFTMKGSSLLRLLNPEYPKFLTLTEKLAKFEPKGEEYDNVRDKINRLIVATEEDYGLKDAENTIFNSDSPQLH